MISLDAIMHKYLILGCLISIFFQPIYLLIRFLTQEDPYFSSGIVPVNLMTIFEKVLISCLLFLIIIITKKVGKPIILHIMLVVLAVAIFEYYTFTGDYIVAFFDFLLIYVFGKEVSTFKDVNMKFSMTSQFIIYAYIAIRCVILYYKNYSFPLVKAITILLTFMSCDLPHVYKLLSTNKLNKMQCKIIQDFETILSLIPNSVVILDTNNSIKFTNKNYKKDLSKYKGIVEKLICDKEEENLKLGHQLFEVHINILNSTLYGIGSKVYNLTNITDLINREREIASDNAKWMFVNIANHQLRTPLYGIESMINFALPIAKEKDKLCGEYLEVAKYSTAGLRHIIDDSILFSQSNEQTIKVEMQIYRLRDLLEKLKLMFDFEASVKKIEFVWNCFITDIVLNSDERKLMHVIYTILSNSFKYTSKGRVTFTLTAEYEENKAILHFIIKDTGSGMNELEKASIFHTFVNAEYLKQNKKISSGLGLFIVKKICDMMEGTIDFQTKEGEGTTFDIKVKCIVIMVSKQAIPNAQTIEIKIGEEPTNPSLSLLSSKKILIVDDNATNLFVLSSMIKKAGITPTSACNGVEAIEAFMKDRQSTIFMDLNMPIMNGLEASRKIVEYARSIGCMSPYIVILSAQDEPRDANEYKDVGIKEWITKPINMKKIKSIIDTKSDAI